jgi:hypothetical protein
MSGRSSPIVLMGALAAEELVVRLLDGLAIRLIATESFPAALAREYKDIDLATRGRDSCRLLFYDEPNKRRRTGVSPHPGTVPGNALLLALDVAPHDRDAINSAWVARLCARDWGLHRTARMNLERLRREIDHAPVGDADRELIVQRAEEIARAIEAEPKGSKWKLRARVGDKVRWYEDPEEVDRHGY